jgi:uncharacterized protein YdeI (YjbR/CyaY-like superfamily)
VETKQDLPVLPFASAAEWETWLAANHGSTRGLWLKLAKASTGIPSLTYLEALDGALCYGWIDGQKAPYDERYWLQKFTPRRKASRWSQINRDKVAALECQGRMKPPGIAQVDAAKADGRWDAAYASQSTITVPEDLQRELDADPALAASFAALDRVNRYAILYRLHDARRPETRARRFAQYMERLRQGKKIHP